MNIAFIDETRAIVSCHLTSEVVVIDISADAAKICQGKGFVVCQGNIAALPFADCSFDVVSSITVIQHVVPEDQEAAIRELQRVLKPGGRMLEVGCGTGQFLEEALRSGHWEVTGVEPSERAASYTREHLKIQVIQDLFSNTDLPESSFDAVIFWNVFEHLYHPIADLRKAQRLLKPGGWVVIGLPNIESWEHFVFKQYWVGWDQPRHLYLFPQKTLRSILEKEGFQQVSTRCISTSYSVLYYSLDFWSQTWSERYPKVRHAMLSAYRSILVRALLVPPLWLMDRLKLSTVITFFGQKSSGKTPPSSA